MGMSVLNARNPIVLPVTLKKILNYHVNVKRQHNITNLTKEFNL